MRIYQPTKTTMQSAKGKTKRWLIDWDVLSGAGRWENNLMGWASSADYMQATQINFRTKEDAIAFVSWVGTFGPALGEWPVLVHLRGIHRKAGSRVAGRPGRRACEISGIAERPSISELELDLVICRGGPR